MTRLATFLSLLAVLAGVTAWGQTPPQLSPAALARIALRGTNLPPGAPPPKYFMVHATPVASHIWRSQDLQRWLDSGTNCITVTNNGGGEYFKGGYLPQVKVTWTGSSNAVGYTLYETADNFPPGAVLTIPLPATNAVTVPALALGANRFQIEEQDPFNTSQYISVPSLPPALINIGAPTITITPTNALPGTNQP